MAAKRMKIQLDTSPDPGLIYIVNGMRLAAAVDAFVIRDGVISMDSHQLYQLNSTDGRTGDYWKAKLGAEVSDRSGFCNSSSTKGMSVCSTD